MLTMENPICDERFYFDEYKPTKEELSDAETEQTWRRLSSSDSFDEQNSWTPPTTNIDSRYFGTKAGQESAANWKDKPVEQWSADEVTLWICSLMNNPTRFGMIGNYSPAVNVAAYLSLTGAELLQLSSSDMLSRDPQTGSFVYLSLQSHLSQIGSHYSISSTVLPSYTHMEPVRPEDSMHTQIAPVVDQRLVKQEPSAKEFAQPRLPSLDLKFISFDVDDHFDSIQSLAKDISMDQLVKNIHGLKGAEKPRAGQLAGPNISAAFPTPVNRSIFTEAGQGTFNMPPMAVWGGEQNQPASSPMISPRSDASSSSPEEMSRDFVGSHFQYNEVKGNHLWEFIRDLLFDSRYNPSLVKWEDREEGVFKFVKSDQVAKLWGKKKNNPVMTYEKLSRAMRYYYRRKILERIDGRRLVYKFGSMATGWKP